MSEPRKTPTGVLKAPAHRVRTPWIRTTGYEEPTSTSADMYGDLDTDPVIIRRVVQANDDLSLDSHQDRELLIQRLIVALANQRSA